MSQSTPTILQILPELRSGGVERGTIEVSESLTNAGWRSLVVSAGGPMTELLKRFGGNHIELPAQSKNPFTILRNAQKLTEIIKAYDVDIVHARSRAPAWSAYRAAKATNTPFITTFHGIYGLQGMKKRYNELTVKGERVIAVSHFVADHILEHYDCPSDKIRVIHRGVDVERFRQELVSGQRVSQMANGWHLPDDKPVILMPGRITRWKGHHVLIEALHQLPHRNFVCVMLGEAGKHMGYKQELEKLIIKLGLEENIRIIPPTTHMVDAYSLADLVVVPSTEPEAFGRVPVEAQAMGKPIITTNHGGACETVEDGVTGWHVEPANAEDLSKTIDLVLNLPAESLQRITQNAIDSAYANFSTAAMCAKVLSVYEEILGKKIPQTDAA